MIKSNIILKIFNRYNEITPIITPGSLYLKATGTPAIPAKKTIMGSSPSQPKPIFIEYFALEINVPLVLIVLSNIFVINAANRVVNSMYPTSHALNSDVINK